MKKRVYFNEYNVSMGSTYYLPLVSGLLQAYAESFPEIRNHYDFMPFLYYMDEPREILKKYTDPPDIAAFSSVMWNEQLNLHMARKIKETYPECLIVFGGPNVPMPPLHSIEKYLRQYPFVDVAVRAEGEESFAEILLRFLDSRDFRNIPGVAFRDKVDHIDFCGQERPFKRDLSEFPSPYMEGLYSRILQDSLHSDVQFQAIIETNRGCPFPCTFCYWGRGGLSRKYKYHDMDRVFADIDWMGKNSIKYVFNADSNFGMNNRDYEIAEFIVTTKKKYGYPEKFRTCFGKNTDEKIFQIGALFHANRLEKGITLARQSNDAETLKNIRRSNIKMSTYVNLQKRFNDQDIPVYGELILGLPGETVETWRKGIDELLEAGIKNQLFIYLCQILPNTEMAEEEHAKKFQIKTKRIKLAEIHGIVRPPEWISEYEDIVISTFSMNTEEWRRMLRFSYVVMLFHSLKIAYFLMIYLRDRYGIKMSEFIEHISDRHFKTGKIMNQELDSYDEIIDRMLEQGEHRGTVLPEYSNFYWDVEEASFLRITKNTDAFYDELLGIVFEFLNQRNADYISDENQIMEVLLYQKSRIPRQSIENFQQSSKEVSFAFNIPEYFDRRFSTTPAQLQNKPQLCTLHPVDWQGDLKRFAKDTILWGRKSGTMLVNHTYEDTDKVGLL